MPDRYFSLWVIQWWRLCLDLHQSVISWSGCDLCSIVLCSSSSCYVPLQKSGGLYGGLLAVNVVKFLLITMLGFFGIVKKWAKKKGCEKMSQKHQKSQARSISVNAIAEKPLLIWDYVAFAAIAVFCFLVFQQSDLLHTAGCSYGYLMVISVIFMIIAEHLIFIRHTCQAFILSLPSGIFRCVCLASWHFQRKICLFLLFYGQSSYHVWSMWQAVCWFIILPSLPEWAARNQSFVHMHALLCQLLFYAQFIFGQYDIIMTFLCTSWRFTII